MWGKMAVLVAAISRSYSQFQLSVGIPAIVNIQVASIITGQDVQVGKLTGAIRQDFGCRQIFSSILFAIHHALLMRKEGSY